MKVVLSSVLMAIAAITASAKTVLKPVNSGSPIGIVLLQGAQIPEDNYAPLGEAIQAASDFGVWVSLPHCGLDACEPLVVSGTVSDGIKQLKDAGFPEDAPIVFGGHSLGGAFIQDWIVSNPGKASAQLLLGSFITRKNRGDVFPVPTLTIAGALDGLTRVSRVAESFYHTVEHAEDKGARDPVVVVPGMSHLQFATGEAPLLVNQRDFKPEITLEEAQKAVAAVVASFFETTFGAQKAIRGQQLLKGALASTRDYVMPLITALEMEGFKQFKPPCNSDNDMEGTCPFYPRYPSKQQSDKKETDCTCATPWSTTAQLMMAGLPDAVDIKVTDAIHSVADVKPIHLPHIWSDVCQDETRGCSVNVTTVSQPVYSTLDALDTAFSYSSADELRVKMKSRETMWNAVGRSDADFHATDEVPSTCADINKAAYAWALKNAHPDALARFEKYGQPYTFAEDSGPYNAGPLWIYNAMKYKETADKSSTEITAPMMHTPKGYFIKSAAGFHYCKLLSPARAMEWIYVDSLRNELQLNNQPKGTTEVEYFMY